MDSLGDYIYIILLVLAGLSGFLKKKKKPVVQPVPQPASVDDDEPAWVFTEKEEEIFSQPAPKFESAPRPLETLESYDNAADTVALRLKKEMKPAVAREIKKEISKPQIPVIIHNNEPDTEPFELEFETADDVRRAVVYSEILAPKYQKM